MNKEEEEEKFYKYLSDFQPDIIRIISSKRRANHLMSVEEIASDLNFNILKRKNKIINFRNEMFDEFNFECFRFQICTFIKNAVIWYQCRKIEDKYNARRLDYVIQTKEGEKNTFEIMEYTEGVEHDFDFDKNQKHKYFLKLIKNYSDHLTKNEVQLIDMLLQGKKQKDMAEEMGVTHQAISFNVIRLEEKLKCRIKNNFLNDECWGKISEGHQSMERLFQSEKG